MSDTFQPKCFDCGEIIGIYYDEFLEKLKSKGTEFIMNNDIRMMLFQSTQKLFVGDILDSMGLTNICCRIPFITYVMKSDVEKYIRGRR